jgi:hypothetical protein
VAIENITTPVDGQAHVDYELILPTGPIQLVSSIVRLIGATYTETVYGYSRANIAIQTATADYVDRVLKSLELSGTPMLRFRIGLGVPDRILWIPWQLHYVRDYRGEFVGVGPISGHRLNLSTEDSLALVDRANRTSAHRGKISDIVQRLADRNGLNNTVIEPTNAQGLWIQSYTGDFEFVRKRLIRIARNTKNHGNYLLFSRDNVLHFHTVDYQADVKELNYYNASSDKLHLLSLPQDKIDMGSAGVRLIGHDPYTGQSRELNSDPSTALRYANWISNIGSVNGAQRNFTFHLSENRGVEALNLTQNTYEAARQECYELSLRTTKTRMLRAGDILNLELEPKSGQASAWTGLWLVAKASHSITKGEINSVYVLQRGELMALKGVSSALIDQGINIVPDTQNAPGTPVNLQQTQVSQLTAGAGKTVNYGVFSQVQDPQKALVPETTTIPLL